ncbi:MAG: LytTR family transcriptional regulator [Peptostreptococcaceae bacterium]|nr:LytTR family transcriptional regulator [Peptostreptococcaceae bacterium]
MKIKIEIDEKLNEEEVVIKCKEMDDDIVALQQSIASTVLRKEKFTVYKKDREYYIKIEDILFFETEGSRIKVHTKNDMYETDLKLYELEELLPGHFMRVSKSGIVNMNHIYSVSKNLTSSSVLEFYETNKQIYVSRHYYRPLKNKLEEMRGK